MVCQWSIGLSPMRQHNSTTSSSRRQGKSRSPESRSFTCTPIAVHFRHGLANALRLRLNLGTQTGYFADVHVHAAIDIDSLRNRSKPRLNGSAACLLSIARFSNASRTGSNDCASSRVKVLMGFCPFSIRRNNHQDQTLYTSRDWTSL